MSALETNANDVPLDLLEATITSAKILDPYTSSGLVPADRSQSIIKTEGRESGEVQTYSNSLHNIKFDLPYRWSVIEAEGKQLGIIIEPTDMEHNVKAQIEKSGFIPKVVITAEPRDPREEVGVSTAFFSVKGGEDLKF